MRFEWLKNYQDLEDQILFLKWNLNKSKLELDRWISGDLAKIRIEKNSRSSKLEETIIAIEDELKILADQKEELLKIIDTFKGLENEIVKIKERNKKVELDKAWETSWTRKMCIGILTYIVVVLY